MYTLQPTMIKGAQSCQEGSRRIMRSCFGLKASLSQRTLFFNTNLLSRCQNPSCGPSDALTF